MPSNWPLFDRIRALTRTHKIFRSERPFQDQSQLDRITAGSEFLDTNQQANILDQTSLHIHRMERYRDYERMDVMGEVSLALDLYCLAGDTNIPLLDGTCPTIAELVESGRQEFWLYGYDFETGLPKPVLGRCPHVSGTDAKLVRVEWHFGYIDCTPTHKFHTKRGWVPAGELVIGDSLTRINLATNFFVSDNIPPSTARNHTVTAIRELQHTAAQVYDLYVDDGHAFAAGTGVSWVLVHNSDEACLSGAVKIPLLDGTCPTIAELAERGPAAVFTVFAYDVALQQHVAATATGARITGRNVPIVKVTYTGTVGIDSITCTGDHLWMLASGVYLPATELLPGMLLQPKVHDTPPTVLSVEADGIADKVYDIEVPQYHCFAAGGNTGWVIVHNSLVDPERKHTLIIRARNRRLKRELEDLFFNILQWDSYCRPTIRYLCKYGDFPAEIVPDAHRGGISSLRFMNVYNFTRIETRYGDLVGFYYQDMIYPQPMFMHPWQVMHLRLTSFENWFHPYGKCLASGTIIDTPTGPTPIQNIKCGDVVYAWNGRQAVPAAVTATASNGIQRVYRISTRRRHLECTPEHPILIDGQGYKQAKDIQPGDRILLPKLSQTATGRSNQAEDTRIPLHLPPPTNGNCIIPIIPGYVDTTFARLFGFLLGDGWVGCSKEYVGFALGVYEEINQRYIDIMGGYGLHKTDCWDGGRISSVRFSNVMLAQLMHNMRLVGRAHQKYVPEWVFRATTEIQTALVDGYVDADGCESVGKQSLNHNIRRHARSTSRRLLEGIQSLVRRLGHKCGRVLGPITNNPVICGKQVQVLHPCYQMIFYHTKAKSNCLTDVEAIREAVTLNTGYAGTLRSLGYKPHGSMFDLLKSRCVEYDINTMHFKGFAWNKGRTAISNSQPVQSRTFDYVTEQVVAVEDLGKESEVYDLQIDGYHNFVAAGMVVHNSVLDGGRKAFKQLQLMEDAALIYRITRAPEKRKFYIPVGLIPAKEIPEYMQMIGRNFKRQRFYNPTTGTFDERYSPLIQEDDFFLPKRPDGSGPDIDVLPGAENLDQIADIEYFKKKMIAPMKIPFARVGLGEGAGEANEKSLSQSHSEFAKSVQWIQRVAALGLTKVAIVHLALRGFSVEDLKGFEIALTATSAMEELYRIETWQTRVNVMADLKELGWFPKEWIVTHFTDLAPDEIEELQELESSASGGGGGGGGLGGSIPGGDDGLLSPEGDVPGGEEAPGEMPGEMPGAIPGEAPGVKPIEGLDYATQRKVLLELSAQRRTRAVMQLVQKWSKKLGKDVTADVSRIVNSFDHIIESKELDGLSKTSSISDVSDVITDDISDKRFVEPHDPNRDAGLLVEWSVEHTARTEVLRETYDILIREHVAVEDVVRPGVPVVEEITEFDLPL